jgi:hypothetical protein
MSFNAKCQLMQFLNRFLALHVGHFGVNLCRLDMFMT